VPHYATFPTVKLLSPQMNQLDGSVKWRNERGLIFKKKKGFICYKKTVLGKLLYDVRV